MNNYAEACEKGEWLEVRIDEAVADHDRSKPDVRKMLVALGPVVIFGPANFPLAIKTGQMNYYRMS